MNFTGPLLKTWTNAFMLSSSAVSFFVLTLGIGIVPFKAGDIFQRTTLSITDCFLFDQGQTVVSTVWTHGFFGRRDHVVIFSLGRGNPVMQSPWPSLVPKVLVGDAVRGRAYVGSVDGRICSVEPSVPEKPPVLIGRHFEGQLHQLACSADGRWLASLHEDSLHIWDLATNDQQSRVICDQVSYVAITSDSRFAICGLTDGRVIELDLASGTVQRTLVKHGQPVARIVLGPRGLMASLSSDGHLIATDSENGVILWERRQGWSPNVLTFSKNGETLISSGRVEPGFGMIVYQTQTGRRLASPRGHGLTLRGIKVSVLGELVAWGADGTVRIWDPLCFNKLIRKNPIKKNPIKSLDSENDHRIITPQWKSLLGVGQFLAHS